MFRIIKNKYSKLNTAIKVAFWYTCCNVLQRGISIITVPVFTRVLSTEQYGVYSLYLSWMNILSIFTCFNLHYGVFNKAMVKYEKDRDTYISAMQGLTITLCTLFFGLYILFREQFNRFSGLSTVIVLMMFVEMLVLPGLQFWSGKQRFEYKYKKYVILCIITTVMNPVLGIAAVLFAEHKTEARIFSVMIVELIVCGTLMIRQFMNGKKFFVKDYWSYSLKFNLPLIPHYLSGALLNQGDRLVIQRICTMTDVALYSIAYNVALLTQLFTNAISQAVTPWLYNCLKKRKYESINNNLNKLMILVGVFCILMMFFAPEIVWIFAAKEYHDAIYAIPPISVSVFFIFVYNIYSNFEFYYEKRYFITIASIISSITNILLNLIFIPMFGYVAAGYTTLFCYMIYGFMHFAFSFRICRCEIRGEFVFQFKILIIISIILTISCPAVSILYNHQFIRYMILIICLILLIIKRDLILQNKIS